MAFRITRFLLVVILLTSDQLEAIHEFLALVNGLPLNAPQTAWRLGNCRACESTVRASPC
jgi:hypothetical protein